MSDETKKAEGALDEVERAAQRAMGCAEDAGAEATDEARHEWWSAESELRAALGCARSDLAALRRAKEEAEGLAATLAKALRGLDEGDGNGGACFGCPSSEAKKGHHDADCIRARDALAAAAKKATP